MKKRLLSLLLAAAMVLTMLPGVAFAADSAADSFTNPFTSGTLNSTSWRIPAMVTLSDGTIVAAADARWDTTYDGGGLDTAVAYSADNGATWTTSLENYLGDNGNAYSGSSTCFIDPALATDGYTVWMLCDLYPYGVALNGNKETTPCSGSTGFNDDGYLLLAKSSSRATSTSDYTYYLKDGKIYSSSGTEESGYTVDADFNLYSNGSYVSNLFFSDSPFKVYPTGYLYLKSSFNGGETWSDPTLLNLKTSSEMVCLVGPGRGLVTSNGNVIFPVYSYNGSTESQQLSFLSMDGQTGTWSRSTSLSFTNLTYTWSSESAVVELKDGTLRFFFRNDNSAICYADYNNGWKDPVNTGVASNSDTQMSAISYSKTVNGDQVILLSCPTGPNGNGTNDNNGAYRTSGKLHIFTVDASTGAMTLQNKINITNVATGALSGSNYTASQGFFAYSCLTEMEDGSVALLYENNQYGWGAGDGKYYTITSASYSEDKLGVTFDSTTSGGTELTDEETGVTVTTESAVLTNVAVTAGTAQTTENSDGTKTVSKTYTITVNGGAYTGAATVKIPYDSAFDGCTSFYLVVDDEQVEEGDAVTKDGNYFVCKVPHFSEVEVYGVMPVDEGGDSTLEDTITSTGGGTATTYVKDTNGVDDGAQYLIVYNGNALTYNGSSFSSTSVTENDDDTLTVTENVTNAIWTYQNEGFYSEAQSVYFYPGNYSLNTGTDATEVIVSEYNNGYQMYLDAGWSKYYLGYSTYNDNWTGSRNSPISVELYKVTKGSAATYTIDAALQESRINDLTVTNDGYTDESWNAYQAALAAAQNMLTEVEDTSYTSEDAANAALNELIAAVNALGTAKNALEKAVVITVNYVCDGVTVTTGTLNVGANDTTATLPAIVSDGTNTYTVDNTTLTLREGVTEYKVAVTKAEFIAELSVPVQGSETISVTLADGQYVEWTCNDDTYAGVMGVYDSTNKAYTNEGTVVGLTETADGEYVVVTGTVYNEDGTVAGVYNWKVTVTASETAEGTGTRYIKIAIDKLENASAYYSINGGELIKVNGTGVIVDETIYAPDLYSFMLFGVPNEGYVLTYMQATLNAGTTDSSTDTNPYYSLSNGNPDGTGSDAWPFASNNPTSIPTTGSDSAWKSGHGLRWPLIQGNFSIEQLKLMFSKALALGGQGVTTVTMNNTDNGDKKDITFTIVAQKLPEMTKEVTSITDKGGNTTNYVEDSGTKLGIGDTVNYTITVYEPVANEEYGTITYSDINIQDPLTGDSWTTKGTAGIETTVTINGYTFTAIPYTYTTSLTLTTQNFTDVVNAGTITNTVTFSYLANSNYASGSVSVAAQAGIHVSVDPSYVVDFGVPLTIHLSDVASYGNIKSITDPDGKTVWSGEDNETATQNGSFTVNITDAQSFTDIAAYRVDLHDGGAYYITIIPASNVLFEAETFMTASGSGVKWSMEGNATVSVQDGSETDPYGYDGIYAEQDAGEYSAGVAYTASVSSESRTTQDLTFTFTGTGFDLIGTCGPDTGTLLVRVDNEDGLYMSYMVDTSFEDKNYGTIYQVPLIHAQDWPEDTYTVTIRGVYMRSDANFGIDAFRVYRSTSDQAYNDAERNAKYYNVLNETILNKDTIQAYTEKSTSTDTEWKVTEYESNGGPQNEIYLAPGQAVAFKVVNSADNSDTHNPLVHFSARALDGNSVTVTVIGLTTRSGSITSGTEMYYAVTASNEGLITIKNESGGILALGNLKLTAALSDGKDDEENETDFGTKVTSGTENTRTVSTFSLRSRAASVQTCGVINVGQPAILVPVDEEDQEIIEDMLDGSGEDAGTETPDDSETGTPDDSGNSGGTGSEGGGVVILPAPDTSADAKDEPEDETADGPESPYLNRDEAYAYITGFADGTVRPMADITRAEVATIFYRMLKDEIRDQYWSNTNDFTDVTSDDWYNTAVSTLAKLGIVTGNPDGSFNPNGKITRAEFATMAVRFYVITEEYDLDETVFSDISTSWAAENILLAYELGLVNGNPDGTFRPGNSITRAEAMTIVNNMLGRKPKVAGLPNEADMITWVDNADKSVWYYAGVQAATNSYTSVYSEEIGGDLWTGVTSVPNWSELEKIWAGKHTED